MATEHHQIEIINHTVMQHLVPSLWQKMAEKRQGLAVMIDGCQEEIEYYHKRQFHSKIHQMETAT